MSGINISESIIRHNANAKSFQRGEAGYRMGSVLCVTQRGEEIQAEVQGSEENPYRVTIGCDNGKFTAICTCAYNYDGWCKHIVATALTCIHEANTIEKRPTLPQLLDRLNHIQTQSLVQELVEEHPELIDEIDGYVNAIALPTPASKTTKSPRKQTVNTAQIKAKVRQIFRDAVNSCESGYDYADETVNEELLSLIQDAVEYCHRDNVNNALAILEAITDACVSDWDYIGDYGGERKKVWERESLVSGFYPLTRLELNQKRVGMSVSGHITLT